MEINKALPLGEVARKEVRPAPGPKTLLDRGLTKVKETTVGDVLKVGGGLMGSSIALAAFIGAGEELGLPAERTLEKAFDGLEKAGPVLGGAAGLGAAYVLGEDALESFREGKAIKGIVETAGAAGSALGGVQSLGQHFDHPLASQAFEKGWNPVLGAAGLGTAVVLGKDAIESYRQGKVYKATAQSVAAAGTGVVGAQLLGKGLGLPGADTLIEKSWLPVLGAASLGAAYALSETARAKYAQGQTRTALAAATGSAGAGLVGAEILGRQFGIPGARVALEKGFLPLLGTGLGAAAVLTGKEAVAQARQGNWREAAGQAGLSFASGFGSVASLGKAFDIPGVNKLADQSLTLAGNGMEKIAQAGAFFAARPNLTWLSVAALTVGGGYAYYQLHKDEFMQEPTPEPKPEPKLEPKPAPKP